MTAALLPARALFHLQLTLFFCISWLKFQLLNNLNLLMSHDGNEKKCFKLTYHLLKNLASLTCGEVSQRSTCSSASQLLRLHKNHAVARQSHFFFLWEPCQQFSNWTTESKIKLDVMTDSRVLLGRRDRRVSGMYCMFNVAIKRQRLYPGYFLLDFCAVGRNKSAKNQTK